MYHKYTYAHMGQSKLLYDFKKDQINVTVKNISYAIESDSINDQKWIPQKEIRYSIDYNGLLISGNAEENGFIDLFQELKENIPFQLKPNH